MLEIKITIKDINYDDLVDLLAPLLAKSVREKGGLLGLLAPKQETVAKYAHKLLQRKSKNECDALACELAEKNHELLRQKVGDFLLEKKVRAAIHDISVKTV